MQRLLEFIRAREGEFSLLVAISVGIVALLRLTSPLSFLQSVAIALPVGIAIVAAFTWLLDRRNRIRDTPLVTEQYPDIGEVRLYSDRWTALVTISPSCGQIEVTADSDRPSREQLALFTSIRQRLDELVEASIAELTGDMSLVRPPLRKEDLVLSSISLDAEEAEFSFYFEVPARKKEMPDGLYADFAGFEVREAGWVH